MANYAIENLKKFNKSNLITSSFPNILSASKLNQLKLLLQLKYFNSEEISDADWKEQILVRILKFSIF